MKDKTREFWQKLLKINSTKAEVIVREIQCKKELAKKEVYDKLLKIFQDCNDCRVFEIQCKLGALLKEIDNSFNTDEVKK